MNGIGCLISKSFSPIYNPVTSNKADTISCRSPNLHLQFQSIPPLLANTHVLKHRVCSSSASKNVTNSSSVSSTDPVVPYGLISLGLMGLTLLKAWEGVESSISSKGKIEGFSKSNARYSFFLKVVTGLVTRGVLDKIADWMSTPSLPFRIGDMIEVGSVEGRVIKMRPTMTELLGAENCSITLPNSVFDSQHFVNRTPAGWYDVISFKIGFEIDEFDKIKEISNEVVNMMKSNPNVLLEVEQPSCYLTGDVKFCFYCHLKHMEPDIYFTAKEDILQQAVEIIKKHGATSVTCNFSSQ